VIFWGGGQNVKKKILVVFFLLSISIFAGSAFALLPGTKTHFLDTENPTGVEWVHTLTQGEFYAKPLDDDEPIIVKRARLFLSLDFTTDEDGKFKAKVAFGDGDLSKLIKFSYLPNASYEDQLWTVKIKPSSLLSQINDNQVEIKILTPTKGSLGYVNYSTIIGKATVAPEPISMVLVGVGIAGLPVAGRFRKFIKRDN
jgi:hypothetical protein